MIIPLLANYNDKCCLLRDNNYASTSLAWKALKRRFLLAILPVVLVVVAVQAQQRVTSGQVMLYNFQEGSGNTVYDVSRAGQPLDLKIYNPGLTSWVPSGCGLTINNTATNVQNFSGVAIQSTAKALATKSTVLGTGLTLEAWLQPAAITNVGPGLPARIMTMSSSVGVRDFMLAQEDGNYVVRVRTDAAPNTTSPDLNGTSPQINVGGASTTSPQHLVFTRDAAGNEAVYLNGVSVYTGTRPGSFSNWEDDLLTIGNEVSYDRPWSGTLYLAAIYNRGISAAEVSQNFNAGKCAIVQPLCAAVAAGQVSGQVYRDFSEDGLRNSSGANVSIGEVGIAGVTVTAYDCNGTAVATTSTTDVGSYTLTGLTTGTQYRIEFSSIPAYLSPSVVGADNGTTVQFITPGNCANLALNDPGEYCGPNPIMAIPCYVNGDALGGGTAGTEPALVTFPALARNADTGPTKIAVASQIGATWGVAYNKFSKKLYTASVTKRHSTYGPAGIDGIYVTDFASAATPTATFVEFANLGISVGTDPHAASAPASKTLTYRDETAFDAVGKTSFGDIDISDDGSRLFVTNLFDRKIYSIPTINPTSANYQSFSINADANCPAGTGVARPWGLKSWRGKLYSGWVCDAQASQSRVNLRAFVYALDPAVAGGNPTLVVQPFSLTFTRGRSNSDPTEVADWYSWKTTPEQNFLINAANNQVIMSQPILGDIEFDVDGSLLMGFIDRNGFQSGYQNYYFSNPANATYGARYNDLFNGYANGDILRSAPNASFTNWTLENNGTSGLITTAGASNTQGPGGGEYYLGDVTIDHDQATQGALALLPGSGNVITVATDSYQCCFNNGMLYLSNTTGGQTGVFQIYSQSEGTSGKATGLGDMELFCAIPPIEIGNYLWRDTNGNGRQDPCEPALSGITVQLFQGSTLVATATTNANGQYYFSSLVRDSSPSAQYTLPLSSATAYQIRIPIVQTGLTNLTLTTANVSSNGTDNIDSDATISGGNAIINLTTGAYGQNNHTFDVGFTFCPTLVQTSNTSLSICSGQLTPTLSLTSNGTSSITFYRSDVVQVNPYAPTGTTTLVGTGTPTSNSLTVAGGSYSLPVNAGTTPTTYYIYALLNPAAADPSCRPSVVYQVTVKPIPVATATGATITCASPTVSLTGTSSVTSPTPTYSWTAPGGNVLTGANPAVSTPGTYTLVVTANGCLSLGVTASVNANTITPVISAQNDGPITCLKPAVTVSKTVPVLQSWTWTGPGGFVSNASNFTTTTAGIYTLTVTAASNGCTAVTTTTIQADNTPPNANAGPDRELTCAITLIQLAGGSTTSNVSYSWTASNGGIIVNGANTATPTINAAGTYTLQVTAANGCVATDVMVVTLNNTPPNANAGVDKVLSCTLTSVVLNGSSTTPGATYLWSTANGVILSGGGTPSPTVSAEGTYLLTVTGPNGCVATDAALVTLDNSLPTVTVSNDGPLTCARTSVLLSATTSPGSVSYRWSGGASSATLSVTTPGTYTLVVTAPNGCTAQASTPVGQDILTPALSLSSNSPLSCSRTSVILSALVSSYVGSYTYRWSTGVTGTGNASTLTLPVSASGTYSLTITAANGCSSSASVVVDQRIVAPVLSLTNNGDLTCSRGSATLAASLTGSSGAGTYTYQWSTGTTGNTVLTASQVTSLSLTVQSAGTFSVTVTAPNGCVTTASTSVGQDLSLPAVTMSQAGPLTCAKATAILSATVTAGAAGGSYVYQWSNLTSTSALALGVAGSQVVSQVVSVSGTYQLTVTGPNGCSVVGSATLNSNTLVPVATASVDRLISCASPTATVTASLTASSGTGSYGYTWTGGASGTVNLNAGQPGSVPLSVSVAGSYSVSVTAPNGCVAVASVVVDSDLTLPNANAGPDKVLNCTLTSVELNGSSTTPGATYLWSATSGGVIVSGGNTASPTVSAGGTYLLTVTAPNGCTATDVVSVSLNNAIPNVSASIDKVLSCTLATVALTGTSSTPGVTYLWTANNGGIIVSGANTATATVSAAGTYILTATAPNGCTALDAATVIQDTNVPQITINNDGPVSCADPVVLISAAASSTAVTFRWSSGQTVASFTAAAGTYSLTVTGSNGCSTTGVTTVLSNTTTPTVSLSSDGPLTCTKTMVTLMAAPTNISGSNYSYRWSTGFAGNSSAPTQATAVDAAGTYSVTVTNSNGCYATATTSVLSNTVAPTVSVSLNGPITCARPQATLTATASPAGTTYRWTGPTGTGATGSTLSVGTIGTYSVVVTSLNGCTATAAVTVTNDLTTPTALLANNGPLTCVKLSAVVSATVGTVGSYAYQWTSPVGTATTGTASATALTLPATTAGLYSLTIVAPNGCSAVAATLLENDTMAPGLLLDNDGPITCDQTFVTITATINSHLNMMHEYRWSTGETGTTESSIFYKSVLTPGPYSLTVTAPNGCSATASTIVSQTLTAPVISVSASGPITCSDPTVSLTASLSNVNAAYSYQWSTGEVGKSSQLSIPFSASVAGIYSLTVNIFNAPPGCSAIASAVVETNTAAPQVTLTNSGPITCLQPAAMLTATVTAFGASYRYALNGGPQSATTSAATQTFPSNGPGSYVLSITAANGCVQSATALVQQTVTSFSVTATGGTISCASGSVKLTATPSLAGAYSALWTGPNNYSSTENSPTVGLAGAYTVVLTNDDNGCLATAIAAVSQDQGLPGASAIGGTLTCSQPTVTLLGASTSANVAFTWSGPGIAGGSKNQQNPVVSLPGIYTLIVTSQGNSCSSVATTEVLLDTTPPDVMTQSGSACVGQTLTLIANSQTGSVTYAWSGPQGFTSTQATVTMPAAVTANGGVYSVTVTNTKTGCYSTTSVQGTVYALPNAWTLSVQEAQCVGIVSQGNGFVSIAGVALTDRYDYTEGAIYAGALSYATASPLPPASGGLLKIIQNIDRGAAKTYVVRVFNASGCFADKVISFTNAPCVCPPPKCVPILVLRRKR
ncbi:PKD domain-containing protein [Fibrella sp. HMF5335]|uniref:PKD domain-containing protein n=1 Tax=Fibrella rubiginis TaxID=2817060 RepID=A0A939K889_9BACT|nr:SdrD B-like domain-containing protein [Fibrella rubiginis]MBO0939475.1 PKD domain-containing protein [Fibrella rubiginis]